MFTKLINSALKKLSQKLNACRSANAIDRYRKGDVNIHLKFIIVLTGPKYDFVFSKFHSTLLAGLITRLPVLPTALNATDALSITSGTRHNVS